MIEYRDSFAPKIDKVAHAFGSFIVTYVVHCHGGYPLWVSALVAFSAGVILEYLQWLGLYLLFIRADENTNSILYVPAANGHNIIIEGGDRPPFWLWLWAKTIGVDKFSLYDVSYNALGIVAYVLLNR